MAETGSCTLVSNEGNGRMVNTCPDTQIVVAGIDRIVPDIDSLDVMMQLLVRSAVGSKMPAYFTIDSARAAPTKRKARRPRTLCLSTTAVMRC